MDKKKLASIALQNLRASKGDAWSYLCECEDTFGYFLWDWCEDEGIDRTDKDAARNAAESGEHGIAWIVPISVNTRVLGFALFLGHAGNAPEDEPSLGGIYGSPEDAKNYLKQIGVVSEKSA